LHEGRLRAYLPDRVYDALRKKFQKVQLLKFREEDNEFIRNNLGKGIGWLAGHFFTSRRTIRERAIHINVKPATSFHKYTDYEDKFILEHVDEMGPTWVAEQLGLTRGKVRSRKRFLKNPVHYAKQHIYTPEEEKFIKINAYKGKKYISSVIGVSAKAIEHKMKHLNVKARKGDINKKRRKVAILGGAFDPITKGHIQLANYVLEKTDIEEVWITPCCFHMYDKDMASADHRLEMCKMATEKYPNIKICDFEIKKFMRGSTYDFLLRLLSHYAYSEKYEFSYIIGMDNANNFDKWKNPDLLKNMVRFIVVSRQGIVRNSQNQWYSSDPHVFLYAGPEIMDVSSTMVRSLIKEKGIENLNKYITEEVAEYIEIHHLYEAEHEEVQKEDAEQERV
jgi:nicotinate-nucleotide adenylyltransferase